MLRPSVSAELLGRRFAPARAPLRLQLRFAASSWLTYPRSPESQASARRAEVLAGAVLLAPAAVGLAGGRRQRPQGCAGLRAPARWRAVSLSATAAGGGGPQVVFVIGGPGSGKGTQCERIAKEFGFHHLSAGDLLRAERKREGSELGELIESICLAGKTVPSEVIAQLLEQAMRDAGWEKAKFIIDGYPRSMEQFEGWDSTLSKKVDFLFTLFIEVGREEMLNRLLARALTSGRSDDNRETIEKRFETFEKETNPLLERFESQGKLMRLDGGRGIDEVWADVRGLIPSESGEAA